MKKIALISILSVAIVSLAFASLTNDSLARALNINSYISHHNLLWKAGSNEGFLQPYENLGVTSLNTLIKKLNGNRELPKSIKDNVFNALKKGPDKLTTMDDDLMSSFAFLTNASAVSDSVFLRREPIRDQGYHGTCWAFSTVASFESAYEVQAMGNADGNVGDKIDLSERWVGYHDVDWTMLSFSGAVQDSNADVGGNVYFSSYNNIRYGELNEDDAPYSDIRYQYTDSIEIGAVSPSAAKIKSTKTGLVLSAAEMKELGYSYNDYINIIKNAIKKYGSLSVSYTVPADFDFYTGGIYTPTTKTPAGGHAVTLVGWVDAAHLNSTVLGSEQDSNAASIISTSISSYTYHDPFTDATNTASLFWVIKNSWSALWGDHGYFVIPAISEAQYDNPSNIGPWEIEDDWMFVPIFETPDATRMANLDVNGDGSVNSADFNYIVDSIGSTDTSVISKCDLSEPKDGVINGEDVAAWVYLYNHQ